MSYTCFNFQLEISFSILHFLKWKKNQSHSQNIWKVMQINYRYHILKLLDNVSKHHKASCGNLEETLCYVSTGVHSNSWQGFRYLCICRTFIMSISNSKGPFELFKCDSFVLFFKIDPKSVNGYDCWGWGISKIAAPALWQVCEKIAHGLFDHLWFNTTFESPFLGWKDTYYMPHDDHKSNYFVH